MPWIGVRELEHALTKVGAQAEAAARDIVRDAAHLVEREAKKNFDGSHAPGEPHVGGDKPNVVTGTLRRSITPDPIARLGFGEYGTHIGPRTVYGRRVELGYTGGDGRGRQKTRAFPYFGPAVEKVTPGFRDLAAARWRAALYRW